MEVSLFMATKSLQYEKTKGKNKLNNNITSAIRSNEQVFLLII